MRTIRPRACRRRHLCVEPLHDLSRRQSPVITVLGRRTPFTLMVSMCAPASTHARAWARHATPSRFVCIPCTPASVAAVQIPASVAGNYADVSDQR